MGAFLVLVKLSSPGIHDLIYYFLVFLILDEMVEMSSPLFLFGLPSKASKYLLQESHLSDLVTSHDVFLKQFLAQGSRPQIFEIFSEFLFFTGFIEFFENLNIFLKRSEGVFFEVFKDITIDLDEKLFVFLILRNL